MQERGRTAVRPYAKIRYRSPSGHFWRQGGDQRLKRLNEGRDMRHYHFPNDEMIDLTIFVGQYIPLGRDPLPGNFRVCLCE